MLVQALANGVIMGCGYALVALGLSLSYRAMGFIDLSAAGLFAIAPYMALLLCSPIPFVPICMALALVLTALAALLVWAIAYQRLAALERNELALIASLGVLVAMQNGLAMGFGDGYPP